jgi:hypothetical protein
MTINKLTDQQIPILENSLKSAIAFYRQRDEEAAKNMVNLLVMADSARKELQEYRKADVEPIYQCQFCHHDDAGELQWHWEDVNKDFFDQYDSERRGDRRVLYAIPQPLNDARLDEVRASAITDALDKSSDYLDTDCVMDRLGISYENAELRSAGAIEFHDAMVSVANQHRKGAAQ